MSSLTCRQHESSHLWVTFTLCTPNVLTTAFFTWKISIFFYLWLFSCDFLSDHPSFTAHPPSATHCLNISSFIFQIFNATRQLSHIETAPEISPLSLWLFKWNLVLIKHHFRKPNNWAASWERNRYSICKQQRIRRACAYVQSARLHGCTGLSDPFVLGKKSQKKQTLPFILPKSVSFFFFFSCNLFFLHLSRQNLCCSLTYPIGQGETSAKEPDLKGWAWALKDWFDRKSEEPFSQYTSISDHCENTPIQIYWKFYNQKRNIFR